MGIIRQAARVVITFNVLFLLLLGFAVVFGSFGPRTQVVTTLALVPIALSTVGAAIVIATEWDPI